MSDQNDMFDDPVGEMDILEVLRKSKTVFVQLPVGPDLKVAGAIVKLASDMMGHALLDAGLRAALQPMLDSMKFDIEAAERGAMPPGNA